MKLISKEIFILSPENGVGVGGRTYYTSLSENTLLSYHGYIHKSDTSDEGFIRFSYDNGRTWSDADSFWTRKKLASGMRCRYWRTCYLDPPTGKSLVLFSSAVLPNDAVREWLTHSFISYSVLEKTDHIPNNEERIIHAGEEFDEKHYMPDITSGVNGMMMGDTTMIPVTRDDGTILVPVQASRAVDGKLYNPFNTFTFHDVIILMGKWQRDGKLSWTSSKRIYGDPSQTTRGLYEPTLAFLYNQRILCVMRGSNTGKPELPGVKWHSISEDGGETWTTASPWSYDDGSIFYSPSACSQLLPLLDGRLFWIGNISKTNVVANGPRYPLFIAEVDKSTGRLIKNSVFEIDTRKDNESPYLTLSNFFARQDRETGDVILYMSRFFAKDFRDGTTPDFTSSAYCYRIST